MICNYINCNYTQQCVVLRNVILLKRRNMSQELHLIYNTYRNQKSQLKVKQLRSLKTILKFLSLQFNLNFELENSKSDFADILSPANFFTSSRSCRRDNSNSLYNQSITWRENVLKFLKNVEKNKFDKRVTTSNDSVNSISYKPQIIIETRNNMKDQERDESREEKRFHAIKTRVIKQLLCNKENVKYKIDMSKVRKLQINNNNTWPTDLEKIIDASIHSENEKLKQTFKKRQLLSMKTNRKSNSKIHKKKHKTLPNKIKVRKSKRRVRSTDDLLFNGNKRIRSARVSPIASNPALPRPANEAIDFKSLPSSSAKNSVNSLPVAGNRAARGGPRGRQIEEVLGKIADALRSEKIAEEERGGLEDPREAAVAGGGSGSRRWPSGVAKNNRRSVSRVGLENSALKIDGAPAKTATTGEERSRRQQQATRQKEEAVRRSADSDKLVANSQDEQSAAVAVGTGNDAITPSGQEKLIFKLSIAKDSKGIGKGDALLLGSLFKGAAKFGKLPGSVMVEIIGPTRGRKKHVGTKISLNHDNFAENDKSFYDDGMELERELKELPKLRFKSRLNKLRNRQEFGKLRDNLREEESNAGAGGDVSKLVDPVQPVPNYPSEFVGRKNIAHETISSSKNKMRSKSKDLRNFFKNREKEKVRDDHKTRDSEELSDKESSVYYYDYYDYNENSGNNFNRHKSNDLRARQVGRKLLSLNSAESDGNISIPGKKSDSNSNEKFYGDQQNEKAGSRPHYPPIEPSSPLFRETGEITEEPSSGLIRCTFHKSAGQFLPDENSGEEDTSRDLYRKNNAEIGFFRRNLKSISPARKSSLPEDDPLRQVLASADVEDHNGEPREKRASARHSRRSDEEDDSMSDLYKLFGRNHELKVKGKLRLNFPKSDSNDTEDSSRRKRCSGRRRPKSRRRRPRRRRKFANPKTRQSYVNDNSIFDGRDVRADESSASAVANSRTPLEKITNFFKDKFGGKARKRIKAKIIKVIPGKSGEHNGEYSDSGDSSALQKDRGSGCRCRECQTTPEVMYSSVAVDTINTEAEVDRRTLGDSTRRPADDSGDNLDGNRGNTRGYQCHCRKVTNEDGTDLTNEQQYQTTISMDNNTPENNSANRESDTQGRPDVETEVSQLPDLRTQTNVVYTTPIVVNTENPISVVNTMTTIDSNGNLANDVIINGDDQRMKDVLDILNFVQKVEKLMVDHKMPFRIGDKSGGVEIKLQKIYIPGKKQSIQNQEDGLARRISNDLSAGPADAVAIHQTVKDSPDSFPLKTKSEENSIPESPSREIKENQIPDGESFPNAGNSQKEIYTEKNV